MKKISRFLLVATGLTVFTSTCGPTPPHPVIGKWESIDAFDGSRQDLSFYADPTGAYDVRYFDYGASVCGPDPATGVLYDATASGLMTASGNEFTGELAVVCQTSPPTSIGNYPFHFVYDPGTDSITDGEGVVWTRP
jgi:hypothetical protein